MCTPPPHSPVEGQKSSGWNTELSVGSGSGSGSVNYIVSRRTVTVGLVELRPVGAAAAGC